ncbi:MAG: hypothetical protein V4628_11585 [Pseudomonadota bacterium]
MKLTNPRQSIHDAFAIHLGGPTDNIGGGHSSGNNKRLSNAGTAGLIIQAVMNQAAHLRGTAIFLNAPENTITMNDMIAMKTGVWTKFAAKNVVDPYHQGVLISHIDRILMGYRSRVHDNNSILHTLGGMFSNYAMQDDLTDEANKILDVLQGFDNRSLSPVIAVIREEREAEDAESNSEAA